MNTVNTQSPDQKNTIATWLRDVFRPAPDADYFLRLASLVESSAPVACPTCA